MCQGYLFFHISIQVNMVLSVSCISASACADLQRYAQKYILDFKKCMYKKLSLKVQAK